MKLSWPAAGFRVVLLLLIAVSSVEGGDVVVGNGAYPRFVRLSDGSVLCAVDGVVGNGQFAAISIFRAPTDTNLTAWAPFSEVTRRLSSDFDVANPHLALLRSPEQILVSFRVRNKHTGESWLDVCTSADGGASWKWLSQLVHSDTPNAHQYEPFLSVLGPNNDRDVLAIFASEVSPEGASVMPDQMLLARLSHDRGATWGGITMVAPRQSGKRPGMPALVDIGKGCFIVFYEMCDNGHWGIFTVFSSNAGGSWEHLHTKLFDSTPYSGSPWATLAWSSQGTPFIRAVWMTDSQAPGNGHPQLFSANLAVQYSPLNVTVAPHATGLYGYWPSVFQARQGTPVLTARSDGPVLAFLEDV